MYVTDLNSLTVYLLLYLEHISDMGNETDCVVFLLHPKAKLKIKTKADFTRLFYM